MSRCEFCGEQIRIYPGAAHWCPKFPGNTNKQWGKPSCDIVGIHEHMKERSVSCNHLWMVYNWAEQWEYGENIGYIVTQVFCQHCLTKKEL